MIDLGCLPDTPFNHLEEAISSLKKEGLKVSVDSANIDELARAANAGVDHLLSLDERTLAILPDRSAVIPVLTATTWGFSLLKTRRKTGRTAQYLSHS